MAKITKKQIEEERKKSILPEYQHAASDELVLGPMIAGYFEWDGYAILRTLGYALEDANFHTIYKELREKYPEAFEE